MREATTERRFVIFTNQAGVGKHTSSEAVRGRICGLLRLLDLPCIVLAAVEENCYRKPRTGMFQLLRRYNNDLDIDLSQSFYVGDAAGRAKAANRPKDHSDVDFMFALNCDLNFLTPEQFMSDVPPHEAHRDNCQSLPGRSYSPRDWLSSRACFARSEGDGHSFASPAAFAEEWTRTAALPRLVVVLVGAAGSGKSHFAQLYCPEWTLISRDKLRDMAACEKALKHLLHSSEAEVRAVVDNTNVDAKSRRPWITLAQQFQCSAVAVWLDVSVEQALHNNSFRRLAALQAGAASAQMVPTFVVRDQASRLQQEVPSLSEGFSRVFRLRCAPTFADDSLRRLYTCFL